MKPGLFITVEGCDGAGKSTAMKRIAEVMHSLQLPCHLTREPGGTPMAEAVREIMLGANSMFPDEEVDGVTEVLMMNVSRRLHIENKIKPALAEGKWVISDRFTDSTYAYQGASGVPMDKLKAIENIVQDEFRPNYVIFLDIRPDKAHERIVNDGTRGKLDHFESKGREFQEKCRKIFLHRAFDDPETTYFHIEADDSLDNVMALVEAAIVEIFVNWRDRNEYGLYPKVRPLSIQRHIDERNGRSIDYASTLGDFVDIPAQWEGENDG